MYVASVILDLSLGRESKPSVLDGTVEIIN